MRRFRNRPMLQNPFYNYEYRPPKLITYKKATELLNLIILLNSKYEAGEEIKNDKYFIWFGNRRVSIGNSNPGWGGAYYCFADDEEFKHSLKVIRNNISRKEYNEILIFLQECLIGVI